MASGTDFDTYLADHVLAPLQMSASTSTATAQGAVTASPQLADRHVMFFGVSVARPELNGFIGRSGGVVSTAADLTSWLRCQLGRGRPILTKGDVSLTHRVPRGVRADYAMGWTERRDGAATLLEHTGILSTYYAYQALIPTSAAGAPAGFAMLFNSYQGLTDYAAIADGVRSILDGYSPTGSPTGCG